MIDNIMESKKAQGLSLNMIIVAILVLIVLVIMIFIFSGKMGDFGQKAETCQAQGGECKKDCNGPTFRTEDCDNCCIELYES